MSPSELAALRGRAINGDKAALKEWLALPKAELPKAEPVKAEPAKEPELPTESEHSFDFEKPKKSKKNKE
jgi:hypothetical protein